MRVATAQLAGTDQNADRVFVVDNAVIVLDGASAFESVDLDPGTYAQALGESIAAQLTDDPAAELPSVVAEAIAIVSKQHDLHSGRSPSSTVSILRARSGEVDLYVLGDSPIYYGTDTETWRLTDDRLRNLALPERAAYEARLSAGHGFDDEHRQLLRRLQATERQHRDIEAGYWIAETHPDAARHALTARVPRNAIGWTVLATDGAADLLAHHGRTDWSDIAQYPADQLAALLAELHEWEQHHDPDGQHLPRAKRHDDKTIAVVHPYGI